MVKKTININRISFRSQCHWVSLSTFPLHAHPKIDDSSGTGELDRTVNGCAGSVMYSLLTLPLVFEPLGSAS
jgi:hypothetical protein